MQQHARGAGLHHAGMRPGLAAVTCRLSQVDQAGLWRAACTCCSDDEPAPLHTYMLDPSRHSTHTWLALCAAAGPLLAYCPPAVLQPRPPSRRWISWTLEDSERVLLRSGEPLAVRACSMHSSLHCSMHPSGAAAAHPAAADSALHCRAAHPCGCALQQAAAPRMLVLAGRDSSGGGAARPGGHTRQLLLAAGVVHLLFTTGALRVRCLPLAIIASQPVLPLEDAARGSCMRCPGAAVHARLQPCCSAC